MCRPNPMRQQGFGLLAFVMATAIVAFTLVVGYAGVMTRHEANQLGPKQQAYIQDSLKRVREAWLAHAMQFDAVSTGNTTTAEGVLRIAQVQPRYGLQAALSDVQTLPAEGISYRSLVLYLPSGTDEQNPPDLDKFRTTGQFVSCSSSSVPCDTRVFVVFNSLEVERGLAKETQLRLARLAQKAQSYFKARMLLDPERNVSVNYFRKPLGDCEVLEQDLGCVDTYQPLVAMDSAAGYSVTRMARSLSLTDEEWVSAWGLPIEASNLQDSETTDPPYTLAFRAARPMGGFFTVKAVQQF